MTKALNGEEARKQAEEFYAELGIRVTTMGFTVHQTYKDREGNRVIVVNPRQKKTKPTDLMSINKVDLSQAEELARRGEQVFFEFLNHDEIEGRKSLAQVKEYLKNKSVSMNKHGNDPCFAVSLSWIRFKRKWPKAA